MRHVHVFKKWWWHKLHGLVVTPLTLHGLLVVSTVQDSQYNISIYIFIVGLEITCLAVVYFKTWREFKVPWVWKTNATILQNVEVFSYCTCQSKASTSPPKQPPGYKFHIHVGQFKAIKCPTLGKLQSLCDLSQSTTCEATTFPFEIIQSPFVLLQAPRHTCIMWNWS